MESSLEEMKDLSFSNPRFPRLPPLPTTPTGATMRLTTNLFRINLKTSNYVYVYSVDFKESIPNDNTVLRKKYIREAKKMMTIAFNKYIFTGSNLFSTHDAGDEIIEIPTSEPQVKAIFKKAHVISLNDLKQYNMNKKDPKKMQTCVYFLNIIIKMLLSSLKMVPMGRTGKYLIMEEADLINEFNLSIVPGYKTSVKLCDSGPLLEIDYTSRILSKTPAYWILKELEQRPDYRRKALEEFKRKSVITWYGNKRSYIIDDIDFNLNPDTHIFDTPEGETNITEYMKNKYKVTIRKRNQPLLVHIRRRRDRPEEKVYFVPELCTIAGLPDEALGVYHIMRQVSLYTKLDPDNRIKKVEKLLDRFSKRKKKVSEVSLPGDICDEWGLQIDHVPVEIIARKASPVRIRLGDNYVKEVEENGQFSIKQKIMEPQNINKWLLVYYEKKDLLVKEFVDALRYVAATFEIKIEYPEFIPIYTTQCEGYIAAIEKYLREKEDEKPKIVVCILPKYSQSDYAEIKSWATTRSPPILTQVIIENTLKKRNESLSICSKILLQINAKIGGKIWQLENISGIPRKTMIVGIDVSRDEKSAYLGMSSTIDPFFSRYYTQIWKLSENTEIAGTMGALVALALRYFFNINNKKVQPELIVIYRDGVGESQKAEVFEVEVNSTLSKIKEFYSTESKPTPGVIFAIVNKKQYIRFFQKNFLERRLRHAPRGGRRGYCEMDTFINPDPGVIVHSDIIDRNLYEFLMMPHYANKDSGVPARIHVIHNSSKASLISFEDLTNSLCYGYDNWQGPIRTPAPCKYAYTCAKLISRYIKKKPNIELLPYKYYI
eukprot:TRINITY_DN1660_c0_g1_i18.p1 TRINITY_DN1660_c0_g1~~TRINITY_DN1660_c0_g1_i18.p1  ORF type:complete len:829 (-),score=118.06 TRINITY_DN1660_c0_g1_i18:192-2678(-)